MVCVHWDGHQGHHSFSDPWTLMMCQQDSNGMKFPMRGSVVCQPWQRMLVDFMLWLESALPAAFWIGWIMIGLYRVFCGIIQRLEMDLNHPAWKEYPDAPGSRWGPLCPWLCTVTDYLTGGRCHD